MSRFLFIIGFALAILSAGAQLAKVGADSVNGRNAQIAAQLASAE